MLFLIKLLGVDLLHHQHHAQDINYSDRMLQMLKPFKQDTILPNSTVYSNGNNGIRKPSNITNPVFETPNGPSMDFSLAANIIDFGIRAYILEENSLGTSNLLQIFPDVNASTGGGNPPYQFMSTSNPDYLTASKPSKLFAFPHVIDIMIRVLTSEGANALSAFEEGLIPTPSGFTPDEYWWEIAEKNSEVYTRRVKVISQGI